MAVKKSNKQEMINVLLVILLHVCFASCIGSPVTVATYNLWNVMFNWNVRKYRISQMIKEAAPDIIAFQEVLQNVKTGRNQMHDIQELVPWLRYQSYHVSQKVIQKNDAYHLDWADEGIGILSQHPMTAEVQNLSHSRSPDKNQRIVLHAKIQHPVAGSLQVSVVHLSYDRNQQCRNIVELTDYLQRSKVTKKIILGDFNVYNNFLWPVGLLQDFESVEAHKHCSSRMSKEEKFVEKGHLHLRFTDTWVKANPSDVGFTFSNMPSPGLESRPDRMYTSENITVKSAYLQGNGEIYKSKFKAHILLERFWTVVGVMRDSKRGLEGRSCLHDCGPHASCRCGICVSGGDKNICNTPHCSECDADKLQYLVVFLVIAVILCFQFIYSFLRVMQTMNNRSHKSCLNIAFCDWFCLCDAKMFLPIADSSDQQYRSYKSSPGTAMFPKLFRCCPPRWRMPPMLLVMCSILLWYFYIQAVFLIFGDTLQSVSSIIPEEMYPSDHLMLVVNAEI